MSKVAIQGNASGTGTFTIAAPNSNTDRTLVLPDEAGTVLTSASAAVYPKGGPAFSAYITSATTLGTSTATKLTFDTEEFDTASCYDTTNYRFTPNVAGYYLITMAFQVAASWTGGHAKLYKSGSEFKSGRTANPAAGDTGSFDVTALIYLNGSTDYVEAYGYVGIGQATTANNVFNYFQGHLVRAA